jgi:hypothetical protein
MVEPGLLQPVPCNGSSYSNYQQKHQIIISGSLVLNQSELKRRVKQVVFVLPVPAGTATLCHRQLYPPSKGL